MPVDVPTSQSPARKTYRVLLVLAVVLVLSVGVFFGYRSTIHRLVSALAFGGIQVAYVLPDDATRWEESAVTELMNPFDSVVRHPSAPGPIVDIARSPVGTFVLVSLTEGGSALYELSHKEYTLVQSFSTKKTEFTVHPTDRLFAVAGDGTVSVVGTNENLMSIGEGHAPAFVQSEQNEDALAYLRGDSVYAHVRSASGWEDEVALYTSDTPFAANARLLGGTEHLSFSNPNSTSAVVARVVSIASPELSFTSGSTIPLVAPALFVGDQLLGVIILPDTPERDTAILFLGSTFKQTTVAIPKGMRTGVLRFIPSL